ncbi:hypothetical protein ABWH93_01220 [Seohaeicola saemankumensis]|uniref:hypothetical protein n=1 Tax=Seohaeicola saemankumensis TaxID=481181 RepID=UPI0035CFD56D
MTTALMMAARKEVQGQITLPDGPDVDDSDLDTDGIALAMAKAVGRIAIQDWKGVGDDNGFALSVSPEGIDALLDIWPIFEAFQTKYVARAMILGAEKTPHRPCRLGVRRGRRLLPSLRGHLPGLPAKPERAADARGLASLGPRPAAQRAVAGLW